jgi:intracellular septation protein
MTTTRPSQKPELSPGLKMALDLGPLLVFVLGYFRPQWFVPVLSHVLPPHIFAGEQGGLFVATALFIPAILIALAISYALTRHLPIMPVVTAVIVVGFGGMTLVLQDETFIKMKPTIVYLLFAVVLLGGLVFRKPLLGMVFDSVFNLTDEGWRKLTLRWGLFFLAMAVLNEVIWRTQSTTFWVNFKAFGFLPLTFLFALSQFPLMKKYSADNTQRPSS